MKVVAFVPIKLNSVRLPKKNTLNLHGKSLSQFIFEKLLKIKSIDEVHVFCSDKSIMNFIPEKVIFTKREVSLDSDETKGNAIYESFINKIYADIYILAHTTSPFIKEISISNALNSVILNQYDSSFSAQLIKTFAWFKHSPLNYQLSQIPKTQDIEPIIIETSGFYIFKRDFFLENSRRIGFVPNIYITDNIESIDIDYKEDFELAKSIDYNFLKENDYV